MAGKGSAPRPFSVSQEHYASEWDRIFAKPEDALAGDGDTFEEKVSISDEMQLHGEKHKPEFRKCPACRGHRLESMHCSLCNGSGLVKHKSEGK